MTRRKVGPGGGDFALNPNRFSGVNVGGGGRANAPKFKRSGKGKRSRNLPLKEGLDAKGFHEQEFKTSINVRVKFKDGKEIVDSVKGLNAGHALARAKSNWPGAAVVRTKKPLP